MAAPATGPPAAVRADGPAPPDPYPVATGRFLEKHEHEIARQVGMRHPKPVRLREVREGEGLPEPDHQLLQRVAREAGAALSPTVLPERRRKMASKSDVQHSGVSSIEDLASPLDGCNRECVMKIDPQILKALLPIIHPLACTWVEKRFAETVATGRRLETRELEIALEVRVRHPECVRLSPVKTLPEPDNQLLQWAAREAELITPKTWGLTFFYGVVMLPGSVSNCAHLAHELHHVAQYESLGSIDLFLKVYLAQIAHFGYDQCPFEVDAAKASAPFDANQAGG